MAAAAVMRKELNSQMQTVVDGVMTLRALPTPFISETLPATWASFVNCRKRKVTRRRLSLNHVRSPTLPLPSFPMLKTPRSREISK